MTIFAIYVIYSCNMCELKYYEIKRNIPLRIMNKYSKTAYFAL